ncbi:MAG: hypothetical protein ACJAUD_002160 [Crocinitomicaceae bacterium]|jgi:hypothetical protein
MRRNNIKFDCSIFRQFDFSIDCLKTDFFICALIEVIFFLKLNKKDTNAQIQGPTILEKEQAVFN